MTEQENTEVVQRAYNHFLQGEIPAVLDLLSQDVEWLIPGPGSAPTAGSWHGREQVGRFFEALSDSMLIHPDGWQFVISSASNGGRYPRAHWS